MDVLREPPRTPCRSCGVFHISPQDALEAVREYVHEDRAADGADLDYEIRQVKRWSILRMNECPDFLSGSERIDWEPIGHHPSNANPESRLNIGFSYANPNAGLDIFHAFQETKLTLDLDVLVAADGSVHHAPVPASYAYASLRRLGGSWQEIFPEG